MINITFRNMHEDECEAIIYFGNWDFEASSDLFPQRNRLVTKVRIILASGIIIAMTVPQFLSISRAAQKGIPFSAAVFDNATTSEMRELIKKSQNNLGLVAPDYFTITDGGQVKATTISQAFSSDMAMNGTDICPTVTYDGVFTEDIMGKGTEIGKELLTYINMYKLNGIIIDFPFAKGADFSDFLSDVKAEIGNNQLGTVVYSNRHSYEYGIINSLCSKVFVNVLKNRADAVVSPYYSVKEGQDQIKSVINNGVDRQKVTLALDMGGRIWGPGWDGSIPVNPRQVEEIVELFAIKERYDSKNGAVYLDFTVKPGQKYYISGQRLYPADYTINMGSSTYVREMLMTSQRMNIGGVALLHMPLAPTDLWDYFYNWLGGGYFTDVVGTFGRDEIMKAYADGIMEGVGNNKFLPYADITRGEAAAIVQRFLNLPLSDKRLPFSDTSGHWAEKYIGACYFGGHMIGGIDGRFMPDAKLTREQAAVLVGRISGIAEKSTYGVFSDVEPDSWSYESIMALHKAGILKGYDDGTFKPTQNLTREEMAILVSRLEKLI